MVNEITDQEFEQKVIKSKTPVVVDMWAPWCVPCRMVAPVMEKVSQKYDGKCSFYKMNVDENPKTAAKFRVMSLPTLMFFKNGEAVNTVVGAVGERALTPKVDEIL
jgi:thioredoxin 1